MSITVTGATPGISLTGTGSVVSVTVTTGAGGGGGGVTVHSLLSGRTVADAHPISAITGLQGVIDGKATAADITAAIDALIDGAPGALDTLNELAAAVNDDASFAASVTSALAGKAPTAHNQSATTITSGTLDIARVPDLAASKITSGTVAQARLGTGSAGAGARFLADDQTYKTVSAGGSNSMSTAAAGARNTYGVPNIVPVATNLTSITENNRIYFAPFRLETAITMTAVHAEIVTAVAASSIQLAIVAASADWTIPDAGAIAWESTQNSAATGGRSVTSLSVSLPAGNYYQVNGGSAAGISMRAFAGKPAQGFAMTIEGRGIRFYGDLTGGGTSGLTNPVPEIAGTAGGNFTPYVFVMEWTTA